MEEVSFNVSVHKPIKFMGISAYVYAIYIFFLFLDLVFTLVVFMAIRNTLVFVISAIITFVLSFILFKVIIFLEQFRPDKALYQLKKKPVLLARDL